MFIKKIALSLALCASSANVVTVYAQTPKLYSSVQEKYNPDQVLLSTSVNNPNTVREVKFYARFNGIDEAFTDTIKIDSTKFDGFAHTLVTIPCGSDLTYRVRVVRTDGSIEKSPYGHLKGIKCADEYIITLQYKRDEVIRRNKKYEIDESNSRQ